MIWGLQLYYQQTCKNRSYHLSPCKLYKIPECSIHGLKFHQGLGSQHQNQEGNRSTLHALQKRLPTSSTRTIMILRYCRIQNFSQSSYTKVACSFTINLTLLHAHIYKGTCNGEVPLIWYGAWYLDPHVWFLP